MKVFVRLFFCKPTYLFRRDIVFSASNYKKIWLIPDFCVYVCGGSELPILFMFSINAYFAKDTFLEQ